MIFAESTTRPVDDKTRDYTVVWCIFYRKVSHSPSKLVSAAEGGKVGSNSTRPAFNIVHEVRWIGIECIRFKLQNKQS